MFLQGNESTVMLANNAAINNTEVKTMRNSKLETRFRSVGVYTISCLWIKKG